jgi:hypothetical protein
MSVVQYRLDLLVLIEASCIPSKKWSRQPYPGISSSGPTRNDAPRSLAIAIDFRILS